MCNITQRKLHVCRFHWYANYPNWWRMHVYPANETKVPIGDKDDHSQIPDTRAPSPWPTNRLSFLATKSISESDLILIHFFKHCIYVLLTSFFLSSADFEDYLVKVVHCVFTRMTHRVRNCQIAICCTACCLPQKTKLMHFNELIHSDKYQFFVQLYMLSYYGHYSNFFRKNRGDQYRKCFAEYAAIESTCQFPMNLKTGYKSVSLFSFIWAT